MTDTISPERRAANMRRIRSKGMKPEMAVRSLSHGLGFRFRLHRRDLPGHPDLVFPRHRKIVMVHGCFWHGHGDPACVDGRRMPKSNLDYWLPKLARNKARDAANFTALIELGWHVAIVWECETRDMAGLSIRLQEFLSGGAERKKLAA